MHEIDVYIYRYTLKEVELPSTLVHSGTPLRPKAARVEPHTHTKRRPKRHAGNFFMVIGKRYDSRARPYVRRIS